MRRNHHIFHVPGAMFWTTVGLAVIILLFAASNVYGAVDGNRAVGTAGAEVVGGADDPDDAAEVESVTMTIDLEEGGAIDLETTLPEVTVDTWDGDDVLVIVERDARPAVSLRGRPVDIQVTRRGKDVRIRALMSPDIDPSDLGISFRILLPGGMKARGAAVKDHYSLTKLTSVLMRALHREAVRWIVR